MVDVVDKVNYTDVASSGSARHEGFATTEEAGKFLGLTCECFLNSRLFHEVIDAESILEVNLEEADRLAQMVGRRS